MTITKFLARLGLNRAFRRWLKEYGSDTTKASLNEEWEEFYKWRQMPKGARKAADACRAADARKAGKIPVLYSNPTHEPDPPFNAIPPSRRRGGMLTSKPAHPERHGRISAQYTPSGDPTNLLGSLSLGDWCQVLNPNPMRSLSRSDWCQVLTPMTPTLKSVM
jgi:hypothetical protein